MTAPRPKQPVGVVRRVVLNAMDLLGIIVLIGSLFQQYNGELLKAIYSLLWAMFLWMQSVYWEKK